jgi:folate-dependent tRNA-U54 methylase TrmFO/GidA
MTTPTKTLRLRPQLRAEIDRIARRSRRTFSEVTQHLIEEALRMRECPGIYFANEPGGREAKVAGSSLGVWEVLRDYLATGRDKRTLRKSLP